MWSFTAVRYLLFVVRFFALRAKKRTTDAIGNTMLPQAKRRYRRIESPETHGTDRAKLDEHTTMSWLRTIERGDHHGEDSGRLVRYASRGAEHCTGADQQRLPAQ